MWCACVRVCVSYHEVCIKVRVVVCQVAHIVSVRESDREGSRAVLLRSKLTGAHLQQRIQLDNEAGPTTQTSVHKYDFVWLYINV